MDWCPVEEPRGLLPITKLMLHSPLVFYADDIIDDPPALILYRECYPENCGNTALEAAVALTLTESAAPDILYTRSVDNAEGSCSPHRTPQLPPLLPQTFPADYRYPVKSIP